MRSEQDTSEPAIPDRAELLEAMLEGTATSIGDEFLSALMVTLVSVFKIRYAAIGRLLGNHNEIRTIRFCADGKLLDNLNYPLAGTPCEKTPRLTTCCLSKAADFFPEDRLIQHFKVDSYLGVPLYSSCHEHLGHILLMDNRPLAEAVATVACKVLELFAQRTAGEIERTELEQTLTTRQAHLDIILNQSRDGLFSTDTSASITFANPAYCSMLGYDTNELIGKNISEIEAIDSPEDVESRTKKLLEHGYDRFVSQHRCKNGSTRDLEISISYSPQTSQFFSIARDLTERFQLERQLQESTERYKAFTELTSDFCFVCQRGVDSPFEIHWLGGQLERITGYNAEEIYAIGFWEPFIHTDDRERVKQSIMRMQPGDQISFELRIFRKDNTIRWVKVHHLCVQTSEKPLILRLYCTARDITRARESALALQAAENAYRTIFNVGNDALFILDPATGMIIDCNRQGSRIFDRPRDVLIGSTLLDLTPPGLPDFGTEKVKKFMQSAADGVPKLYEWPCSRPDKSTFWSEISLSATDINGRNRLLAVVRDITESKLVAEQLAESEHRFRALVEQVPHLPVQGYDSDRRVIFWNQSSVELYGYSREEALGRRFEDLIIPPEMREGVIEAIHQWIENGIPIQPSELRLLTKSGAMVDVFSSHAMLRNIRGEYEMYCIDLDISSQKQAAFELQQARDTAQSATTAKNEFLANMSHEVRTPLNGIMGLSQLLRTTELTLEQIEYLDMLDKSSLNLLSLINDILDISRIEAGSLRLENIPFSPESLLREVIGIYEQPAAEKGIELKLVINDRLPTPLYGDPLRLKQILINLVGNSVKFTSSGGVTLTVTELVSKNEIIWLDFEVSDSGIGMSPETVRKVFNPFTQADSSTARIHGGSGLGLAICRRLTDLMQGSIQLESTIGVGSRFNVRLPFEAYNLLEEAVEFKDSKEDTSQFTKNSSILLVEDQDVNRIFVQKLLQHQGFMVTAASNGVDALELLEKCDFDLVLLDIQMPGMGGDEVLARLRSSEHGTAKHQLVIALTAHALTGDRELLLESGFDGYVAKPVQMAQLLSEMGELLTKRGLLKK